MQAASTESNKTNEKLDDQEVPEYKAPKGFDILLADAISQFNLSREQIEQLGNMTHKREIANAQIGQRTYYRRATIERLFSNGE